MTLLDSHVKSQSWQESVTQAGGAALLAAAVVALAGAWLTPGGVANWPVAGGVAATYVATVLTVAATIGWWRLSVRERKRGCEARKLLGRLVAVAAWLAPAAILSARNSWIALPVAAALGVLSARVFVTEDVGRDSPENMEMPQVEKLGALAPSPTATRRRIAAQLAVVVAYGGAVLAVLGWIAAAAPMTGIACAIIAGLAARISADKRDRHTVARTAAGISLAILVTTTAFLPGGSSRGFRGPEGTAAAPAPRHRYSSVILLADPPPEPALKAPALPGSWGRTEVSALSIPFSGEYWYYFWPLRGPSDDGLRKFGSPVALAYSWVDEGRLIMQARQPLADPIELFSYRGIDVVLKGREERPNNVYLELALRSVPGAPLVSLGVEPLPALRSRRVSLSFATPRDGSIGSVDQIVVSFRLDPDLRRSPNVAIERFNLIP